MAVWDIKERYDLVRANQDELNIQGSRGIFMGGFAPTVSAGECDIVDYISIAHGGLAADFGNLSAARSQNAGFGSNSRAICSGGGGPDNGGDCMNVIDIATIMSTGNFADFGNLSVARRGVSGCSNQTRGLTNGGEEPGLSDVIDFITIASAGNAADFGNLVTAGGGTGSLSSPTRAVVSEGYISPGAASTNLAFYEIASTGNATDFGDLVDARHDTYGLSNGVRGLFAGDHPRTNVIEYITIASAGDAADFGDLDGSRGYMGGCSGGQTGLFAGGKDPGFVNTIMKVQIDTLGNAVDFGDLTVARGETMPGTSNAHGGLKDEDIFHPRPSVTYMPGSGRVLLQGGNAPYGGRIEKFNVTTLGGSVDFGDSVLGGASARDLSAAVGSLTRAIFAGGDTPSKTNTIDSIEFASEGNAADFGNLNESVAGSAGCSSTTRAVIGLGGNPSQYPGTIEYLTMATASNATDFGDMSVTRSGPASTGSNTRGIFAAGQEPSASNVIDYVTIASTGNATDFGDCTGASIFKAGVSSATRGVFMGGTATAHIEYVTIGSTGNGTDFGDLVNGNRAYVGGGSNSIRGVCFGGDPANTHMDYITFASTGDSLDFGDLSLARVAASGASDSHGGLQA